MGPVGRNGNFSVAGSIGDERKKKKIGHEGENCPFNYGQKHRCALYSIWEMAGIVFTLSVSVFVFPHNLFICIVREPLFHL